MHAGSRTLNLVMALGTVLATALAVPALAADPAPAHQHEHPPAAAQPGQQSEATGAMSSMQHMKAMHEKMMAAKTPAERQALMDEDMKVMHEAMGAMHRMGGDGKDTSKAVQMRMDMMTMMMQMMMDREEMGDGLSKDPPKAVK